MTLKKTFITGSVTLSLLTGLLLAPLNALAAPKPVNPFDQCKAEERAFSQAFDKARQAIAKDRSDDTFRSALESIGEAYHQTMACAFNKAEGSLLSNNEKSFETISANTANFPDLNTPAVACIDESKLVKTIFDLKAMTATGQDLYNRYSDTLSRLLILYGNQSTAPAGSVDLSAQLQQGNAFKQRVEDEAQNSLVALDNAFLMLANMKQMFWIHVQLQCLLKNLATYRDLLETVRKITALWPGMIENASISR